MKTIIDLHQDLLLYVTRPDLYKDRQQTSFEQLKKNNIKIVVASAFPAVPDENYLDSITNFLIEGDLKIYNTYCETHPEFMIIRTKGDLDFVLNTENKFGIILHIEGLNVFDEETGWEMLNRWYTLGLRSIGPLWNINNPFGGGTLDEALGLTELGKKLISWTQEKGIIFDFAHMNERTFWDAAKLITKPIFVSHGNARALCNNVRNYSDEQIKKVKDTGGVIGTFFSKRFLSENSYPKIEDVLKQINYVKNIGGNNIVAIGSDFGGIISGFAENLNSIDNLQILIQQLKSSELQDKFAYKNAYRILTAYLN